MKLKKCFLSVCLGVALTTPAYSSFLGDQTEKMFQETLTNGTDAGAYETRQRGVVYGGRLSTRNKITNVQLLSFSLPSISAGCGGIDIFGGSFSFINSDQLIALMRSIASNALSYAFSIALEAMAPMVKEVIDKLNDLAQKINSSNINSCRIAKGLVTSVASLIPNESVQQTVKNNESLWESITGRKTDYNETFNSNESNTKDMSEEEYVMYIGGNITYQAVSRAEALKVFGATNNTDNIMQALSVTGMVIVTSKDNEENKSGGVDVEIKYEKPLLRFDDLIDTPKNTSLPFYKCIATETSTLNSCTSVEITTKSDFESMSHKVMRLLIGENSKADTDTYIGMLSENPEGVAPSNEIKALFSIFPALQENLVRLARKNPSKEKLIEFVQKYSETISFSYTQALINNLFDTVLQAISNSQIANKNEAEKTLESYKKDFNDQALAWSNTHHVKFDDLNQAVTQELSSMQGTDNSQFEVQDHSNKENK